MVTKEEIGRNQWPLSHLQKGKGRENWHTVSILSIITVLCGVWSVECVCGVCVLRIHFPRLCLLSFYRSAEIADMHCHDQLYMCSRDLNSGLRP